MEVSVDSIKALRARTGAGIMDCKRALQETDGDLDRAEEALRRQGIVAASKKASRETNQGLVDSYIHSGGRIGAIVEVNCETDFVARTSEFRDLAHNVAMQVAAMNPAYISEDDIPEDDSRPPAQVTLLLQPFIKNTSVQVGEIVQELAAKVGENVKVIRFRRLALEE